MSKGFESKLLYDQHSPSEEGTSVLSSVYAILWTYPGAVTKTSARIRTTIVYHKDGEMIVVLGGAIEKWRNDKKLEITKDRRPDLLKKEKK